MEGGQQNLMEYRYLGNSGLKVSILSFGNMANVWSPEAQELTTQTVKKCIGYGMNFFDTAEAYGYGTAETLLGQAFKDLNVKREEIVVATKVFFNVGTNGVGLSRKHIIEGTKNSLKRLQLDYVDIIYAHKWETDTPLEEICRAFSWLVDQGLSLYWGTSEWPADSISEAIQLCQKLNLHAPISEQCQYNMLMRDNFEKNYCGLFERYKLGTAVWSPLAQGVLTGRYNDGNVPEDSRFLKDGMKMLADRILGMYFAPHKKEKTVQILQALEQTAKELGYSQCQLALAWCLANRDCSTLILGFSRVEQLDENIKALELYKKWNKDLEEKLSKILNNDPEPIINFKTFGPKPQRRLLAVLGKP